MNSVINISSFKSIDTDPGGTLKRFKAYVEEMNLLFQLIFRKSSRTAFTPTDAEKKAMMLLKGGHDMKNLFQNVGNVSEKDTFEEAVKKIENGLQARTNKVVQRNMLLSNFPQGAKSFERWSQEISNTARLISYDNYDWKQAAVDAMILQTSCPKLRERALQENTTYDSLMKLGIAKEESAKGAALLAQTGAQSSLGSHIKVEEQVRRLQYENKKLKAKIESTQTSKSQCYRCGRDSCPRGNKCPANGKQCQKCKKMNHFAKVCRASTKKKKMTFGQISSAEESDSEESSGRIVVGHLEDSRSIAAKITIQGPLKKDPQRISLATDTGISKTLLNSCDWNKIKESCRFVKTSKRFRPYGTAYHLPIKGKAKVTLQAENGAETETWIYVVNDKNEQSLLGKADAV